MPTTTPDGRSWWTSRRIVARLGAAMLEDERVPQELKDYLLAHKQVALDVMEDAFVELNFGMELKILRLTEKLKDAVLGGEFGPITVPNTVDVNGQQILTPVGEIGEIFRDIYLMEFLDLHDEEGNLLPDA